MADGWRGLEIPGARPGCVRLPEEVVHPVQRVVDRRIRVLGPAGCGTAGPPCQRPGRSSARRRRARRCRSTARTTAAPSSISAPCPPPAPESWPALAASRRPWRHCQHSLSTATVCQFRGLTALRALTDSEQSESRGPPPRKSTASHKFTLAVSSSSQVNDEGQSPQRDDLHATVLC
eukprot:SAG22_NODE_1774_length_3609_cov_3.611681_1_plen_177_part_00